MPRVSRKAAEQHKAKVVHAASRLFRRYGFDKVSVPALMAEAGLTHGAFYGQFASKEALAVAACASAFAEKRTYYDELAARAAADPEDGTRALYIKRYTKTAHRDERAEGCPIAALAGDVGREDAKGPVRAAFVAGLNLLIERLPDVLARGGRKADREDVLASLSLLVGALVLSRASEGSSLSDEFLTAARNQLLAH